MIKTDVANWGLHLLELEITGRCNENCDTCYNIHRRTGKELPLQTIISLIQVANEEKVGKVVLSGGEASLYGQFSDLVAGFSAFASKPQIVIQTNGSLVDRSPEEIKAFDIIHLSFEIDHGARKVSMGETLKRARHFKDLGVFTYLFATIHKGNKDKIDFLVEKAKEAGFQMGFNICLPTDHCHDIALSEGERLDVIKKLHGLFLKDKILRFTSPITAVLKGQTTDDYIGIKGGCTAGIASCTILPNGDVIPCPFLKKVVGNIFESSLRDIWFNSEALGVLRDRSKYLGKCGKCSFLSYCGGCRARAYAKDGLLNDEDPSCLKDELCA